MGNQQLAAVFARRPDPSADVSPEHVFRPIGSYLLRSPAVQYVPRKCGQLHRKNHLWTRNFNGFVASLSKGSDYVTALVASAEAYLGMNVYPRTHLIVRCPMVNLSPIVLSATTSVLNLEDSRKYEPWHRLGLHPLRDVIRPHYVHQKLYSASP